MPNRPTFRRALVRALPLVLAACASQEPRPRFGPAMRTTPLQTTQGLSPALADAAQRAQQPGLPSAEERARIFRGTGVLVKGQQPGGGMPPGQPVQATGNSIVLNFEGADLREVVRSILGDTLDEAYTIDASVGGTVTLRTTTGIPREALPATLEMLLRMNGAAMVKEAGIYKIVPQAAAVRGNVTPQLGNSQRALPPGFSVQIVPLRYIGVREMMRILEPFAKDASAVRPDELRNMLILSGTEQELRHLVETIDMFDIDWMAGMSVGVFTLQNADVKIGRSGARQGGRRQGDEPARRHPAHHPDRAPERAARDHPAARVPRRGEEVDRAARPGRHRRRPELLRLQPAEPARREAGPAPHAGVHGARAARLRDASAHGRARARRRARS